MRYVIVLLFLASNLLAQDYWVYIRKETKITNKNDLKQVKGMSNTGDIVEIIPCTPQYTPTAEEEKTYKIVKVKDLTTEDVAQLKDTIRDNGKVIKYRRYNVDFNDFSNKEEITKKKIGEKTNDKITKTYIKFDSSKQ